MTEHEIRMIDLYNRLYIEKMLWFLLGSLLSADNFWERGVDDEKLINSYRYNIAQLKDVERLIEFATDIPEDERIKIKEHATDGIKLLEKELEEIK